MALPVSFPSGDTALAMSQDNVEHVRRCYAVPYGGEEWLALVDEFVAADCEVADRTLPEVAAGLKGPTALRAAAAYMTDAFEDVNYEAEDVLDLDDQVAVRVRGSGRGKGSGVHIGGTLGHLFTFHAGKVVRLEVYGTWDEALEAAGLRE